MPSPRREFGRPFGLLLLAVLPATPLAAQLSWNARLGATYTTSMVTDQIAGNEVTLRPTVEPTLAVEVLTPLHGKTPMEATAELQVTTGTLESHQNGSTTRVAGMRTFALTGGVRGRFIAPLQWRVGLGFISYATSEKAGVFQAGAPIRPAATAALEYDRPLTAAFHFSAALRYDLHSFTTKQLEANGFTGSQTVHRVGLSVGVSR